LKNYIKIEQIITDNKNKIIDAIKNEDLIIRKGMVLQSSSLIIRASMPMACIGDICHIVLPKTSKKILAQVVGFREKDVFLMPLASESGLGPSCEVIPTNKPFLLKVGYELLGRVLNGLGQPIDNLGSLDHLDDWPLHRSSPAPYERKPTKDAICLGIRAIDGFLTVAKGQRIGLFAGSGVGKSSLMAQIVRNAQIPIVVVCLVGERGREVMEFVNETLGQEGLKKSVIIAATSDEPSLVRYSSAYVATSIAEWFREQGEDVLFLMDSATRFARAQREIGLSLGEPAARQGYPPSVFAQLPKLLERTGWSDKGSITAIYTILVQGGDLEEPIADEMRGILDGHIVLDRQLAQKNHWPAIDILSSLSRLMNKVVDKEHLDNANSLRNLLAIYEKNKDLIMLGAYKKGTDELLDKAVEKNHYLNKFLQQNFDEKANYKETKKYLEQLANL